MSNVDQLRERFLADFGVTGGLRVKTHTTPPVRVGQDEWTFTLRKAEKSEDVVWTTLNSGMVMGTDLSQQVANDILVTRAQMALTRGNGLTS